ncbi:hypothetical protein [Streptomyces sp. HPF1205]|uniref:hypothetical protein n=1 Tax=Streptomyces sp. HPF1205 TaxID=2873262 RepID=UPI001CED6178|nr:hypothetical protein [Streptomyces sp. HPF1205]
MRTFVPHHPGGDVPAGWGLRRAARLDFPEPAALSRDPEHGERLRVYLTDLLRPYGLGLDDGAPARGGHSYADMAEELIRLAVPAGESVDLLVLAYRVPDITPGRATATYLSHVCPGVPMAFAVSDQGNAAAFTALRLIRAYARDAGTRRALLLVVEQPALPYDPGVPVAVPAVACGVALLFGERRPGERPVGLGPVTTRAGAGPRVLAAGAGELIGGGPAPVTVVLAAAPAARVPAFPGVRRLRTADAGRPFTGVWWELAGELARPDKAPRRLVLADHDARPRHLCLAVFDAGAQEGADAGADTGVDAGVGTAAGRSAR